MRTGPLRRRIGRGDELRPHRRGRTNSRIIDDRQIFLHRAAGIVLRRACVPLRAGRRALLVGVGGKAFRADQSLRQAALHYRLEQLPQDVVLPEASMAIFGKAGMVGDLAVQAQAAEPAAGEMEMHFLTEPPFRPDIGLDASITHYGLVGRTEQTPR